MSGCRVRVGESEREAQGRRTNERNGAKEKERAIDVAMRYLARRSLTEGAARMEK